MKNNILSLFTKKTLTIIMVLAMAFTLIPMVPVGDVVDDAIATTGKIITVGTSDASCSNISDALATASNYDTIMLKSDITESNMIDVIDSNIILDLNGHVLTRKNDGSIIWNSGTLTITDSNINSVHYFEVQNNGLWKLQRDITTADYTFDAVNGLKKDSKITDDIPECGKIIAVKGGVITGGTGSGGVEGEGGKVVGAGICNKGILVLNSINIIGNNAVYSGKEGKGSGVYNSLGSNFTAINSAIVGNHASEQGGAMLNKAGSTVEIKGGYIAYNTSDQYSAGIGNAGNATLSDCNIIGNRIIGSRAKFAAGIDWWDGSLALSGKVVVSNNKTNGNDDNLYLEFDIERMILDAGLCSGSDIRVWHQKSPIGTVQIKVATSANADLIKSDIREYETVTSGGNVLLRQKSFYQKTFYVDGTNNSLEYMDGTFSHPYKTIASATNIISNSDATIELLSNIVVSESDCTFATDTNIALNGHTITYGKGKKFKCINGSTITFKIKNDTDLQHAGEISQQNEDINYIWKVENDINLGEQIIVNATYGNFKTITIDGQGYTITASKSVQTPENQAFYFRNNTCGEKAVEFKNITIKVGNGFGSGICFDKDNHNDHPSINATLSNVKIELEQTEDIKYRCGVINNSSNITIKDKFTLITNGLSWAGMNNDAKRSNAVLTFATGADINLVDNRKTDIKSSEPFIGFDNVGVEEHEVFFNNYADIALMHVVKGTKEGYDLPTAESPSIYLPDPYVKADDGTLMKESEVYKYNEQLHQAEVARIQEEAKDWRVACRTKLGKKGIKVYAYLDGLATEELERYLASRKYTVSYDWYRADGKGKKYKFVNTTEKNSYYNTSVKNGKTYYYKCKITIYDQDGQIVRTQLTDCTKGYRTFRKNA